MTLSGCDSLACRYQTVHLLVLAPGKPDYLEPYLGNESIRLPSGGRGLRGKEKVW